MLKTLKNKFLEGPDWVELPNYSFRGYHPRTLILITWLYAFYNRALSIPARMILSVSALVIVYSFTLITTPITILALSIISIFVTDVVLGFIFRPKLKIRRIIPEKVRANSVVKVEYYIQNIRILPALFVRLDPYPFKKDVFGFSPVSVSWLGSNEEIQAETDISITKRGIYVLYTPIAESLFPFGLFKWSCRGKTKNKIIVHPDYTPLISFSLSKGIEYQPDKDIMLANKGDSPDFFGCREFMPGDDPKHIHWLTSARRNELVIKEYQEEYLARSALILDTFFPEKNIVNTILFPKKQTSPLFEAAVSLTAAVADSLLAKDSIVDIFAAGPEVFHFKGARSSACFERILDILAGLDMNCSHSVLSLKSEILKYMSALGNAVIILINWDKSSQEFINELHSYGLTGKVLLIKSKKTKYEIPVPNYINILDEKDITEGRIRYL